MAESLSHCLVVAISSRTLFDLEESHSIFTRQGLAAYSRYQIEHEDDRLEPGVAFTLVKKTFAAQCPRSGQARGSDSAVA